MNEEYARRFQHNKEREELHRLKEKHPEIAARLEVGARALPDTDKSETESVEEDDGFIPERTGQPARPV